MPTFIQVPDRFAPVDQVLAPPYPDLLAVPTFSFLLNHSERTVCVSGYIRNIGNENIRKPFKVAIGVTTVRAGITTSSQRIFTINRSINIGQQIETPCTLRPLFYIDEPGNARYSVEMLVDIDNNISELKSSNNRYTLPDWYFLSPQTVRGVDGFEINTSPENQ